MHIKNGYRIFGAGEYKKWFSETFVNINPFEWIEIFRNAQMVFTGTFHGAVFSIKSRKNFYTYLTNPSREKKVKSLLKQFKIEDNVIDSNNYKYIFENIEKFNINYEEVNKIIEELKEYSLKYLSENIE